MSLLALENDVEELALIDYDDLEHSNHLDNVLALDSTMRGIKAAAESMNQLVRIKDILKRQQDRPVNKSALKIGLLALENIQNNLQLESSLSVTLEQCIASDTGYEVAMEGFNDFIKKIWDAICRAFKYVWDAIGSLFKTNEVKQIQSLAKNNQAEVKEVIEKIKDGRILPDKVGLVKDNNYLMPLAFLGKNITDKELLKFVDSQPVLVKRLKQTFNSLLEMTALLELDIHNLETKEYEDSLVSTIGSRIIAFFQDWTTLFDKEKSNPLDAHMLATKFNVQKQFVDSSTVFSISNFLYGSKYYIFSLTDDETDLLKWLGYYDDQSKTHRDIPKMKVISHESLELYESKMVSLMGEFSYLEEDYKRAYDVVRLKQNSLLGQMDAILLKLVKEERQDNAIKFVEVTRGLIDSLLNLTKDVSILMLQAQRNHTFLVRLGSHFIQRYKDSTVTA